jgi:hypothetical protein
MHHADATSRFTNNLVADRLSDRVTKDLVTDCITSRFSNNLVADRLSDWVANDVITDCIASRGAAVK